MTGDKTKCYLASGWFNNRDRRIIDFLEKKLEKNPLVDAYRPRKDGIQLSPNDFHDHALRKKVFMSNVENIDKAEFLVSNLDCGSDRLDTGTVWETAYAIGKGIPVFAYQDSPDVIGLTSRLGEFTYYMTWVKSGRDKFNDDITRMIERLNNPHIKAQVCDFVGEKSNKPVFLCDNTQNTDEMVTLLDTLPCLKIVSNPKGVNKEELLSILHAPYIIIPTDTRDACITFYMGLAYALGTPVFTYSAGKNPLNLMLIFSVVKHITGIEDLKDTVSQITRKGVDSFSEYDTSDIQVY